MAERTSLLTLLLIFALPSCGPGIQLGATGSLANQAPVVINQSLVIASEDITTRRVTLSWSPATDDYSADSSLEYAAYLSTTDSVATFESADAGAIRVLSFTKNVFQATAAALTPGTVYYLNVFVRDSEGEISKYSRTAITTDAFAGGDGSSGAPYQIATLANLNSVREDLAAYYVLIDDIDASPTATWYDRRGFAPLGTPTDPFTGNIEGNYFSISGLHIGRSNEDYVGLIGYSTSTRAVRELKLLNATITGNNYVGLLAGHAVGTSFSRSILLGQISANGDYAGGAIGSAGAGSTITDVLSGVSVSGRSYVGGLVGTNAASITYSGADASVSSSASQTSNAFTGGLVGHNSGSIRYCYAKGHVSARGSYVGGFAGQITGAGVVVDFSVATGDVEGESYIGGFVGSVSTSSTVRSCLAEGHILATGTAAVGGFVGRTASATVSANLATGVINATAAVAGQAGTFAGVIGAGTTAIGNMGRDRSSLSCMGTNLVGGSTCRLVTTGTIKPFVPVSFDEPLNFVQLRYSRSGKNLRKIGYADQSQYRISGGCSIDGATISVTGSISTTTTCDSYHWTAALNLSAVADGNITLTVTQNADAANAKTLNLYKDTSFCSSSPSSGSFAGGAGSAGDPYTICTSAQLQAVGSNLASNTYFKLMNNIDLSGGFTPIAAGGSGTFRGNFDGNGFVIRNLVISSDTDEQGLFGEVALTNTNTRVLNLGVEDARVMGSLFVSPLIGAMSRTGPIGVNDIYDLYTTGVVVGMNLVNSTDGARVGGIAGEIKDDSRSDFTYLFSSTTVISHNRTSGGLFGRLSNNDYSLSYATGHILGSGDGCGGFVGQALISTGKISLSYATGSGFFDTTQNPGSFAGYIDAGSIENCYGSGNVFGSLKGNGFISYLTNGASIHFAYHSGQILFYTLFENSGFATALGAGTTINDSFTVSSMSLSTSGAGFLRQINGGDGTGATVNNCFFWNHSWSPSTCIQTDTNTTEADTCSNAVTSLSDFMDTTAAGVFNNWTFDNVTGPWKVMNGTDLPRLYWEP
jgi:hypothetical protein